MQRDLTKGKITGTMITFALPMMAGNLLQQLYNVADTLIVGKFLGTDALAAVGSAYTLMTFLTSIILGLCMGSGAVFSLQYGERRMDKLRNSMFVSFLLIAAVTAVLNAGVFLLLDPILGLLQTPADIYEMEREYLMVIFTGIGFTFLYNYFASVLRAVGDSVVPLLFLAVSTILNIILDIVFISVLHRGAAGAAEATVIAQGVSAAGIAGYTWRKEKELRVGRRDMRVGRRAVNEILEFSLLTCVQQSVMNFGILMIQGLVNSFGTAVMAAFAVAVKIDTLAYMPAQDFGNAFSVFTAQNYGAGKMERIRKGMKSCMLTMFGFCLMISAVVFLFAEPLMRIFVEQGETEILAVGVQYLRIEGAFYVGIGCLFQLYGLYRGIKKPAMSLVLTVISLGTRVGLAYLLAPIPAIGVLGIWWAIPIGWFLADAAGLWYYRKIRLSAAGK